MVRYLLFHMAKGKLEGGWTRLSLEHSELELSNNLAENAMRPVALGRRNWIHIGSKQAGPRVAAIVSVVETCRRLKIPVRDILSRYYRDWQTSRSIGSQSSRPLRAWLNTDRANPVE
jgi:hypothetical protein